MKYLTEAINKLINLSLTNAKPYRIANGTAYTDGKGFAIHVETTITITDITTSCQGAALTSLAPGLYYIPIDSITISGGSAFVYRR